MDKGPRERRCEATSQPSPFLHPKSKTTKTLCHNSCRTAQFTPQFLHICTIFVALFFSCFLPQTQADRDIAFFNSTSSLITIRDTVWELKGRKEFAFRTCSDSGMLLFMNGTLLSSSTSSTSSSSINTSSSLSRFQELTLSLYNSSVLFVWSVNGQSDSVFVGRNVNNNRWHTVELKFYLGEVILSVSENGGTMANSVVVANRTMNPLLLDVRLSGDLMVGSQFTGCINQGPGVNFQSTALDSRQVVWNSCPLAQQQGCTVVDRDKDDCWNLPCLNGATCIDGVNDFTCQCPPNYNGTRCENDLAELYGCAVEPCLNGGTCLPRLPTAQNPRKFTCSCAEGYTGTICDSTLNICGTQPCVHGTCINGVSSYVCNCTGTGYQGMNCSEDINECATGLPCGQYPCFNKAGGYTCECPIGMYGTPCQEIDECSSNPCKNGGTCQDLRADFSCRCMPGYMGPTCEEEVNECDSSPCRNPHTRCVDLFNSYRCVCDTGYTGTPPNCQNINECDSNVCQNNATCQDTDGDYICSCKPGFTDKNCSTNFDDCAASPCLNGATCVDLVNGFRCVCPAGYTDDDCGTDIDDCVNHQCRNGAACLDQLNGYQCQCQAGWTGRFCNSNINECVPNPCENGARCHDYLNFYNCTCAPGYTGQNCSTNIDDCQSSPCQNGGQCEDLVNDYFCDCPLDRMGKNCELAYDACVALSPCQNGATCWTVPTERYYNCTCPSGFNGINCENNKDDCYLVDCQPFEVCLDGINNATCACPLGYEGDQCQDEIDECDPNPCQNGATCIDGLGNYTCICQQREIDLRYLVGPKGLFISGFRGENCEIDINECEEYTDPPVCQQNSECRNEPYGKFECHCKMDQENNVLPFGYFCERNNTYCDGATPCMNGGSCVSVFITTRCDCVDGYTGALCETDIDDCEVNPCQNGGTCQDRVNGYVCTCPEGITGPSCEINIDDCDPNQCQHGGICDDLINDFSCNCTGTGYEGDLCENNINDCLSNPCLNGATCIDGVNTVNCTCQPGYTGSACEIDIPECSPSPCRYNSLCLEYSNRTLYGKGDPRFVEFSYDKAAGYLCVCVAGATGINCEIDINECESNPCLNGASCVDRFNGIECKCLPGYRDVICSTEINECEELNPCRNRGRCTDLVADYNCTCPTPQAGIVNYGGKNCTTLLRGCQGRNCGHGKCIPELLNEQQDLHSYYCVCDPGFMGVHCDQPTIVSFSPGTYFSNNHSASVFDLTLRFKTTLRNAAIVLCRMSSDTYVFVELHDGKVQVNYQNQFVSSSWQFDSVTAVNDGEPHPLQLLISTNISATLPNDYCNNDSGQGDSVCEMVQTFAPIDPRPVLRYYIGNVKVSGFDPTTEFSSVKTDYVGCMDDLRVNGQLFYLGSPYGTFIGVSPVCLREPQCYADTCSGHGTCEDLWSSFQCHCDRPYFGHICEEEYTPATFAQASGSYANYNLPPNIIDNFELSFFIVTRQENGFILFGKNGLPVNQQDLTFLGLTIKDGSLAGDFYKCRYIKQFANIFPISDGERHLISVDVKATYFKILVDSQVVFEDLSVPAWCSNRFGFSILSLNIGKIPQSVLTRKKRDVAWMLEDLQSDSAGHRETRSLGGRVRRQASVTDRSIINSYDSMDSFDGVLQDLQINGDNLAFTADQNSYPSPADANITLGRRNTQDLCLDSPCLNGGTCQPVFFNDFMCECVRGYRGKNCSEPDFCSYGSCAPEATCVNLQQGYECVSTAGFFNDDSIATYRLNGTISDSSLTFDFRSRGRFGIIFLLRKGDYFIKVRMGNNKLEVNYKMNSEFSKTSVMNEHVTMTDGQWYRAQLDIVNGTTMTLSVYQGSDLVDRTPPVTLETTNTNFMDMVRTGEIIIGNSDLLKYSRGWEASYKGCLREVRIGGVLLPFYLDESFENNTAVSVKFIAERLVDVTPHCDGEDVCAQSKCVNGGKCIDMWNDYRCGCSVGVTGVLCEDDIDTCLSGQCLNGGQCVDRVQGPDCYCQPGYTGDACEVDVDQCNATNAALCENNASCVDRGYDFICNCSDSSDWTGWFCNVTRQQSCRANPCQNNGACFTEPTNGATYFNCNCSDGYEGPLCERAIDYCVVNGLVCQNGGVCSSHTQHLNYTCDCTNTGYTGVNCTEPIRVCDGVDCGMGTCTPNGTAGYVCYCPNEWTGPSCEIRVDLCQNSSYCARGVCSNNKCDCAGTGYVGTHCETEENECNRTEPICLNGGQCTDLEGDFNCSCALGYFGKTCAEPRCSDDLCTSTKNGHCRTNSTNWFCVCEDFVEGSRCEFRGPCADKPCNVKNTKECVQSIPDDDYNCTCNTGWEGKNCTEDIDECSDGRDDCDNGVCVNLDGGFECNCTAGYTDRRCSTDIDDCASRTECKNGGRCEDGVNKFTCDCTGTGYQGTTCEDDINECKDTAICNQGTCLNTDGSYVCDCGDRYLGKNCEKDDPCYNITCLNEGSCNRNESSSGLVTGYCDCTQGFAGEVCERSLAVKDDELDLALVIGPIVGAVLLVIIIILLIMFFMTARSKRATRGAYSPSQQETSGSRVELGNVLKKPPEERLI